MVLRLRPGPASPWRTGSADQGSRTPECRTGESHERVRARDHRARGTPQRRRDTIEETALAGERAGADLGSTAAARGRLTDLTRERREALRLRDGRNRADILGARVSPQRRLTLEERAGVTDDGLHAAAEADLLLLRTWLQRAGRLDHANRIQRRMTQLLWTRPVEERLRSADEDRTSVSDERRRALPLRARSAEERRTARRDRTRHAGARRRVVRTCGLEQRRLTRDRETRVCRERRLDASAHRRRRGCRCANRIRGTEHRRCRAAECVARLRRQCRLRTLPLGAGDVLQRRQANEPRARVTGKRRPALLDGTRSAEERRLRTEAGARDECRTAVERTRAPDERDLRRNRSCCCEPFERLES